jgi:hypothetical protein
LTQQYFFNLFSLGRPVTTEDVEPAPRCSDLAIVCATFLCSGALSRISRTRIAVVGSGNIFPELRIDHESPVKPEGTGKSGAMSEQSADSGRGNEQVPQKLVHLVGCRDPNARLDPWVRPLPVAAKR